MALFIKKSRRIEFQWKLASHINYEKPVTLFIFILIMFSEKDQSIGKGLRGQNIQLPPKINVNGLIVKPIKPKTNHEDYSPLNIEPK